MQDLVKAENKKNVPKYCLIFRIKDRPVDEGRNDLMTLLMKKGFEFNEATGCRACFEDDEKNYNTFKDICFAFAKKRKANIETFRMIDPGLGLMYELYFDPNYSLDQGYPILSTFKLPKEVTNYDYC